MKGQSWHSLSHMSLTPAAVHHVVSSTAVHHVVSYTEQHCCPPGDELYWTVLLSTMWSVADSFALLSCTYWVTKVDQMYIDHDSCHGIPGSSGWNVSLYVHWFTKYIWLLFQITRSPWTQVTSNPNVRHTVSVAEQLQPGTNCTFYVCYWYYDSSFFLVLGRESPASCITGKSLCCLCQKREGNIL